MAHKGERKGVIFNIQRCSTQDGPGIRTTVFLKGCPLNCFWCQNPESQMAKSEIFLYKDKCTSCGRCVEACLTGASSLLGEGSTIDRRECIGCGRCAEVCPNDARSLVGKQVTVDEVPIKENNPLRPASPYAVSKVGEDMLALQYWSSWKIKTIRSRMFTHTGPRRGEVFVVSNFARQVAMIEAELAEPVVKVGNLDSVRTFSDVRDAVRAYWLLVNKCQPGEVYNIGGVETMTVGQMLDQLLAISTVKNIKVEVDPARLRPSDVTLQIPCVDKFYKATGWKPQIKFEETLKDTLDYWRDYYRKKQEVGQDQRVEPAVI